MSKEKCIIGAIFCILIIYWGLNQYIRQKKLERITAKGAWIYDCYGIAHCSECGREVQPCEISRYCPDCGANMELEDEDG